MAPFSFDIVGFDLDGTLLDTSADLAAALNRALEAAGRAPLPVATVRPMIGGGARHMLARGLAASGGGDDALLDRLLHLLLDHYAANLCVHTRPFAGAEAALDRLAARGVSLAVVTNKREEFAVPLLERTGLLGRFAAVIGGDTLGVGKPDPRPVAEMVRRCGGGAAAFVGDSVYDVRAARGAGLPVIACAFGFLDRPADALGADAVIDGFDELDAALLRVAAP